MNTKTLAKFEARAKIFKALAHPTRLFIVDQLSRQEKQCVCELTEMIGVDMSTVSRHLSLLKNAGIVEDERQGSMIFYRLRMKCVLKFFDCIETVLEANAENQRQLLS